MPAYKRLYTIILFCCIKGVFKVVDRILQDCYYLESVLNQNLIKVLSSYSGIFFQLLTDFSDCTSLHSQGAFKEINLHVSYNLHHLDFSIPLLGEVVDIYTIESLPEEAIMAMF